MPFSKSSSDSSRGSSSLSSRFTICSSSANAFSNSFDVVRGILIGPERFDAHRLRIDGALQPSFLELHFDRIADLDDRGVEDRLPFVARSGERDGVSARQYRERRYGIERRGDRFELLALASDARWEKRKRTARGRQARPQRTRARLDESIQNDALTMHPLALRRQAALDDVPNAADVMLHLRAEIALRANDDLRRGRWRRRAQIGDAIAHREIRF